MWTTKKRYFLPNSIVCRWGKNLCGVLRNSLHFSDTSIYAHVDYNGFFCAVSVSFQRNQHKTFEISTDYFRLFVCYVNSKNKRTNKHVKPNALVKKKLIE